MGDLIYCMNGTIIRCHDVRGIIYHLLTRWPKVLQWQPRTAKPESTVLADTTRWTDDIKRVVGRHKIVVFGHKSLIQVFGGHFRTHRWRPTPETTTTSKAFYVYLWFFYSHRITIYICLPLIRCIKLTFLTAIW